MESSENQESLMQRGVIQVEEKTKIKKVLKTTKRIKEKDGTQSPAGPSEGKIRVKDESSITGDVKEKKKKRRLVLYFNKILKINL